MIGWADIYGMGYGWMRLRRHQTEEPRHGVSEATQVGVTHSVTTLPSFPARAVQSEAEAQA